MPSRVAAKCVQRLIGTSEWANRQPLSPISTPKWFTEKSPIRKRCASPPFFHWLKRSDSRLDDFPEGNAVG